MNMNTYILKPQSHQAYDQVTTYLRPKHWQIVERTYDWSQRSYYWSQRSWVIARGKSVATRSMIMFKTCNLRFQIVSGRTILVVQLVVPHYYRWHHQSIAHFSSSCFGDVSGVQVTPHTAPDAIYRKIDRRGHD